MSCIEELRRAPWGEQRAGGHQKSKHLELGCPKWAALSIWDFPSCKKCLVLAIFGGGQGAGGVGEHPPAVSQALPLPPPPLPPPLPFWPAPAPVSGARGLSAARAAAGPRASPGNKLGMKTSAPKRSNGENRQKDTCARPGAPVLSRAPALFFWGDLGHLGDAALLWGRLLISRTGRVCFQAVLLLVFYFQPWSNHAVGDARGSKGAWP